jgi:DNA-directed RNA polymerase subunit M/transcription elongation factor TFIIS
MVAKKKKPRQRTRRRKKNDRRAAAVKKLRLHCRKMGKNAHFCKKLDAEMWRRASAQSTPLLFYMRACRRVVANYTGQNLTPVAVLDQTTLDWLPPLAAQEWASVQQEAAKETQTSLLQFSDNKSLLQCGRCQEFKVSYYQRQTRSADEPMSVFATCHACGKKWKQ